MADFLTVSDVARRYGIQPRKISDLFYDRKLDDSQCPIVNRARIIPAAYLPELERVLRELGLIEEIAKCR